MGAGCGAVGRDWAEAIAAYASDASDRPLVRIRRITCHLVADESRSNRRTVGGDIDAATPSRRPDGPRESAPSLPLVSQSRVILRTAEARVERVAGKQFVVRAALGDDAVIQQEDHVGAADRRQAMRDGDRRPAAHQS